MDGDLGFITSAVASHDLFIQELAEFVSRLNGKVILIGLIHQSFVSYSNNSFHESHDEWNKVQGRFLNLIFNPDPADHLQLIAHQFKASKLAQQFYTPQIFDLNANLATYVQKNYQIYNLSTQLLCHCLPLHAITALLIIALSKKPYGQNDRTINNIVFSKQPYSLKAFLGNISIQDSNKPLYMPWHFYDFLNNNLDLINDHQDKHLWIIAENLIERLILKNASIPALQLFKTIAVIEILGSMLKLKAHKDLLSFAIPQTEDLKNALNFLQAQKVILFRQTQQSFFLYNSSDFDFQSAFQQAYAQTKFNCKAFYQDLAVNRQIFARRHYCQTGTLRYMSIKIINFADLNSVLTAQFICQSDEIGQFILVFCQNDQERDSVIQKSLILPSYQILAIIDDPKVFTQNRELQALKILEHDPNLSGDPIARHEVKQNLELCERELHSLYVQLVLKAKFLIEQKTDPVPLTHEQLTKIASDLADHLFTCSFYTNNELINRNKIPSNITLARNKLLEHILHHANQENLGIVGKPAEFTLYQSLLATTHLHHQNLITQEYELTYKSPLVTAETRTFFHLTETKILQLPEKTLPELYQMWSQPPFGIKEGLKPILFFIFLLDNLNSIALYVNNIFVTEINDDLIDEILIDPNSISYKCYDNELNNALTIQIKHCLDHFFKTDLPLIPLTLARKLFAFIKHLPSITLNSKQLSDCAQKLKNKIQSSNDPIQLLYEDLPELFPELSQNHDQLTKTLQELNEFKRKKFTEIQNELLKSFNLTNLKDLQDRAQTLTTKGLSNFKLQAFCDLIIKHAQDPDYLTERLIVLCTQKTDRNWNDLILKETLQDIASLALKFRQAERSFAYQDLKEDLRTQRAYQQILTTLNGLNHNQKLALISKLELDL